MCLIVRQLPMRAGWWHGSLMHQNLAEQSAWHELWDVAHSAQMGAPRLSCLYPSYLHSQLCLPSEPILQKFPQWHYQELPLNHKSPPTRTYSIVPFHGDSSNSPPSTQSSPTYNPKEPTVSVAHDVCSRLTTWLYMVKINTTFINKDFTKTFFHIIINLC